MSMATIGRFFLYRGELLRLNLAGKVGLHCSRGRMLVTASHESRDHELYPGDRLSCGGLVLVEGEGELIVERSGLPRWLAGSGEIELIGLQQH
jgi:hypothetical protein